MDQQIARDVFGELRTILARYADRLSVQRDQADDYYLDAGIYPRTGKPLFFGAVQVKKNYVSFHLMPVYVYPDLLDGVSEELRGRMQGKSCFNFKRAEDALFAELAALTERGFARYEADGYLPGG